MTISQKMSNFFWKIKYRGEGKQIVIQLFLKQIKSVITFLDKPSKPGTPEITDYDNESADIRWGPSASDGGSPITHYIIQKKEGSKDWEVVDKLRTPTGNELLEFKVTGLVEKTKVQFRVIAVNKGGESEPSDPSPTHTVKHRKRKTASQKNILLLIFFTIFRKSKFLIFLYFLAS